MGAQVILSSYNRKQFRAVYSNPIRMGGMAVDTGTTRSVHFIVINGVQSHVQIMAENLIPYGDDKTWTTSQVKKSGIYPLSADGSGNGRALAILNWANYLHFIVTCMNIGLPST